ncbi:hypothetical protein CR513_47043, partial [Mucuna pruriens]
MSAHLMSNINQVDQLDPEPTNNTSSSPSPLAEVKQLPGHLKYAYLGIDKELPEQEEKLLHFLRQHKKAIGWKLSNLPSINPSIYMHRILMEESPNKAITKKVESDHPRRGQEGRFIYPISDSQWVSLVQVVPKKSMMTVMKNHHDELKNWRVCIDYGKLNQATRKDHFPFPFIDQVLEKLVGKSHYCFLDGFSGYMQIHIAPEDQHKTTFTYPFGTFAY